MTSRICGRPRWSSRTASKLHGLPQGKHRLQGGASAPPFAWEPQAHAGEAALFCTDRPHLSLKAFAFSKLFGGYLGDWQQVYSPLVCPCGELLSSGLPPATECPGVDQGGRRHFGGVPRLTDIFCGPPAARRPAVPAKAMGAFKAATVVACARSRSGLCLRCPSVLQNVRLPVRHASNALYGLPADVKNAARHTGDGRRSQEGAPERRQEEPKAGKNQRLRCK